MSRNAWKAKQRTHATQIWLASVNAIKNEQYDARLPPVAEIGLAPQATCRL